MRFNLVTLPSTPSCFTTDGTDYRSFLRQSPGISHLLSGIPLRWHSKTPLFDAFDSSIALITLLLHFFHSLFQTLNYLKWLNGWFVISWKHFVMLNYLSAKIILVHWLVHALFRIPRVFIAISTLHVQSCNVAYFESCACSWEMHHLWTSKENKMFSFDLFWTCLEVVLVFDPLDTLLIGVKNFYELYRWRWKMWLLKFLDRNFMWKWVKYFWKIK